MAPGDLSNNISTTDPPPTSRPLPRRPPRPQPAVLFGICYLTTLALWSLDMISTFILIAICREHFSSFSTFTKVAAIFKFILDGLTLLSLSKLQYLHIILFLSWEIIAVMPVVLYLASRLVSGAQLWHLEYIFVILSLLSNACQLVVKWSWKWYFSPKITDAWHATFEPSWSMTEENKWLRRLDFSDAKGWFSNSQ
jgi:hypothetical protein